MRYLQLTLLSISTCAAAVFLSGCSSSTVMQSGSGSAPTVVNVGVQVNGVAPNRWQYVQFNEAMDPATINDQTIVVKDSSGSAVSGNVAYEASFDVAGFQPNPALQENATYSLTVTTGAASAQGAHMAAAYSYQFTTRASEDTSPIYVKSVSPFPDANCVTATTQITITFSEGADVSTLNSSNIVITGPGNMVIPAQMSYDVATATLTLTPSSPLPSGSITVTVNNVADAAGEKMPSPFAWSFLTTCSGSGGGQATTQYQAELFNFGGSPVIHGKVTVDTSGNTTVQLTGAPASTTYTAQFCPAFDSADFSATPLPCFNVTTVATDASGNSTVTVNFPKSGNWAGDFYLNDSTGKAIFQTYLPAGVANETYFATLLPESKTDGGVVTTSSPQDPLTSGTVSYSNGSLQLTVKGALPSVKYDTNESETTYIDSSGTYELTSFSTDANGNGTLTTTLDGIGGDLFQVIHYGPNFQNAGAGFIGGFSVP